MTSSAPKLGSLITVMGLYRIVASNVNIRIRVPSTYRRDGAVGGRVDGHCNCGSRAHHVLIAALRNPALLFDNGVIAGHPP